MYHPLYKILYHGSLSYLEALSKLMEAESSKSAMHDMDKRLNAQAHELAKYQNRCKELEMELFNLTRTSELLSAELEQERLLTQVSSFEITVF
jgi:hypothetical protein